MENILATIIDEKHNEVRALAGTTSFATLDQAAKAASPVRGFSSALARDSTIGYGLIAELRAIQAQGYATDNEEFMDDMVAIAVPIVDDAGRLLSTLSIHAPVQRASLEDLKSHLDLMKDTATKLTRLVLED